MRTVEHELESIVRQVAPVLLTFAESDASTCPAPGMWSAKQVIGHLIDSAANNHLRFVNAQFKDDLLFPGYDGAAWVAVQSYQNASWRDLVVLWQSYNLHLARVIAAVPAAVRHKARERHSLHVIAWQPVSESEATTLEYLLRDYVGHLKHHLVGVFAALGQQWQPSPEGPAV